LRSKFADVAANCQLDRVFELFDFDLFGALAWITIDAEELFPYPHGRKLDTWNRTAANADLHVLDIRTHPADQLEWLLRVRPDYLFSYANNLKAVADLIRHAQAAALGLKSIISTGEILAADTRNSIERAFGCRVIDIYGAREIGQIAFECPSADRYHLCSELVFTEIVDRDGMPVRPGELGRVVVTPLYNYAMPFIRYDLGDYAIASLSPCTCGRGLPCVDQIVGRIRNLFVMPDGSKKWPAITAGMARLLPYRQFQMVQLDPFTLQFRYVPASAGEATDPSGLISYLREMFHRDLKVQVVAVDEMERTPGGKFEMFMSRVGT
jgi:phenylacetate-CoA ligase